MADLSLDEVIRRRSFNARGVSKRPIYGRGAGPVGGAFDARQMIGSGDVRQRLGVKDAREKLGQKDARFRIRGRGGGAGAVQDARQLLNSRKQQQAPPPMDARDRLSLKRSVPTTSNQTPLVTRAGYRSRFFDTDTLTSIPVPERHFFS
uniref:Polymerase delta-interacting protein 3-like n=1 Tax=Sinocyclocheilus grahami TaxID=75366 RepID=A0A672K7X4_SINGR